MVLETTWENDEGRVRILDFMPPRGEAPDVVRIVEGIERQVQIRSELVIRFDYGHILPWVRRIDGDRVAVAGPGRALPPHARAHLRREHAHDLRGRPSTRASGSRSC